MRSCIFTPLKSQTDYAIININYTVMATPFKVKLQKAQSSCIEFDKIASVPLVGMCTAPSDAIGCPVEFIFFPLLTIVLLQHAWVSMLT